MGYNIRTESEGMGWGFVQKLYIVFVERCINLLWVLFGVFLPLSCLTFIHV